MAVPQQQPPRACTSCLCLVLLVVGLLCALQDEPPMPKPSARRRPPQPLRTFDDVKLDLLEEEAPQVTPFEVAVAIAPSMRCS